MKTLHNLCLEEIVSKFSLHYRAYCRTEDSRKMLKFEFLKKKFSFHILQKLYKKHLLKTEHLDFLINKYLKVLDTRWLENWPWDTVFQKLSEIGQNLEEVIFSDRPWEKVLCYLPNLKCVFFQRHCTDEFLVCLTKFCIRVETIDVQYSSGVSDDGLKHLCCKDDCKNPCLFHAPIKELLIESTKVGDEGIAYILKNMPSLEKTDYWKLPKVLYSMHISDINAFDKVKPYNLTHLNLLTMLFHGDMFNDFVTLCAFVCPHLKSFSCRVDQNQHLDLCFQLHEVEELYLNCWNEHPLELNELLTLNGKKLTSLKLSNFCISLSVLAENCQSLNLLHLDKVNLQHNVNDSLPIIHNLEKVVLENFTLIDPVITHAITCLLSSAPNLNQLCFKSCELLSSEIKTEILRCCEQCKLNAIDFSYSDVDFIFVRYVLLTCSTLETLSLDECDLLYDYKAIGELETIATSLPNKPQICFEKELNSFSDNDEFSMNESDDDTDSDQDFDYDMDFDYDLDSDDDDEMD